MELSVIIVNYNVKYFLEQALLAVRMASAGLEVEVFVVDNNSVDDSVAMVREKFPEVKLLLNRQNVGFSRANNQAIAQANGKYILLLNPDTVVEENTFKACLGFMDEHPEAGALGVKMIDGSGNFLPESKRGFPSPFVAFCKAFGLSALFPRSRVFNRYHLGFLDPDEVHPVEVLAGAFMLLRKKVLEKVGWLDEAFFMYGEDIDLSYRINRAGYKNYYFPKTTIIHYKGESTKKGSLNYVRVFYNAMIIFARKHFQGEKAWLFIAMLKVAIYFRAALTLVANWIKRLYLPVLDAAVIFAGLVYLKNFWASYYFHDPDYYPSSFLYFNAPLYIGIWLTGIYFSGGYDNDTNLRKLIRGLLFGTLLLAAVYGFLELEYRPSRILIVLGTVWAMFATIFLRFAVHFLRFRDFNFGRQKTSNLVIVGSMEESERVMQLLHQAEQQKKFIGVVAPAGVNDTGQYLSQLAQLDEVVHIYQADELIFCSKDISAQDIMHWMTQLGPDYSYKIVPRESLSIIGSASKNSAGELYTIDIRFRIAAVNSRRNKRLLDIAVCLALLVTGPFWLLLSRHRGKLWRGIWEVGLGKKSWVGYIPTEQGAADLPPIRPGVFTPLSALRLKSVNLPTKERLNFLYAKDYTAQQDVDIIWKVIC